MWLCVICARDSNVICSTRRGEYVVVNRRAKCQDGNVIGNVIDGNFGGTAVQTWNVPIFGTFRNGYTCIYMCLSVGGLECSWQAIWTHVPVLETAVCSFWWIAKIWLVIDMRTIFLWEQNWYDQQNVVAQRAKIGGLYINLYCSRYKIRISNNFKTFWNRNMYSILWNQWTCWTIILKKANIWFSRPIDKYHIQGFSCLFFYIWCWTFYSMYPDNRLVLIGKTYNTILWIYLYILDFTLIWLYDFGYLLCASIKKSFDSLAG